MTSPNSLGEGEEDESSFIEKKSVLTSSSNDTTESFLSDPNLSSDPAASPRIKRNSRMFDSSSSIPTYPSDEDAPPLTQAHSFSKIDHLRKKSNKKNARTLSGSGLSWVSKEEQAPETPESSLIHKQQVSQLLKEGKVELDQQNWTLQLFLHQMTWISASSTYIVKMDDILGACLNFRDKTIFFLHTAEYSFRDEKRVQKTFWFVCETEDQAERWVSAIRNILNDTPLDSPLISRKAILMIGNPQESGVSDTIEQAKRTFEDFFLKIDTLELKENDMMKKAQEMVFGTYQVIFCVGSTLILHQFVNGILKRQNGKEILSRISFCVVGTWNTPNAIESQITINDLTTAIHTALKGKVKKIPLFSVNPLQAIQASEKHTVYGILGIEWAGMSEIDFEENAWFGSISFFVNVGVKSLFSNVTTKHPCNLTIFGKKGWKPSESQPGPLASITSTLFKKNGDVNEQSMQLFDLETITFQGEIDLFAACNFRCIRPSIQTAPLAFMEEAWLDILYTKENLSSTKVSSLLAQMRSDAKHPLDPDLNYVKAKAFVLDHKASGKILIDSIPFVSKSPIRVEIHPDITLNLLYPLEKNI